MLHPSRALIEFHNIFLKISALSCLCSRPLAQIRVQKFSSESGEKLVYVMNNLHNDHLFCYGIVSCEQLQETHITIHGIGQDISMPANPIDF